MATKIKPKSKPAKAQAKIGKVMHEWKQGKLNAGIDHAGKGPRKDPVVKSQKQALVIDISQAGASKPNKGKNGNCNHRETILAEFI